MKYYKIEDHYFKEEINNDPMTCKYCNFIYYTYSQRESGFPKCLSYEEKIIKDVIE